MMHLTGIILFFGSLIAMILWIINVIIQLSSIEAFMIKHMGGEIKINVLPFIVLFIVMAISAGMAWG